MLKLVRDNIPAIMFSKGQKPTIETVKGEIYLMELKKKLNEEVCEFIADPCVEEMADILEVLYVLAENFNFDAPVLKTEEKKERKELSELKKHLVEEKDKFIALASEKTFIKINNLLVELANVMNIPLAKLENVRQNKLKERGGFKNGILLKVAKV